MQLDLSTMPGAYHLPRANWEVIAAWIFKEVPEAERPQAWGAAVLQWLDRLNEALGGCYQSQVVGEMVLFFHKDHPHAGSLPKLAASTFATVIEVLGEAAGSYGEAPLPVLVLASAGSYHSYLSQYYPASEHGDSGGVCIRGKDLLQVVLPPIASIALERALAHELTHACLAHLNLPRWLEEGITQTVEARLDRSGGFVLQSEDAVGLRQYWQERGLRDFWWGRAFQRAGAGQSASYNLALVLFQLLLVDHRKRLGPFLRQADANDAGDMAARQVVGKGLADLAAQFLGPGDWTPVPTGPLEYSQRGLFYLERGMNNRALPDFDHVVRQEPENVEAFLHRGMAYSRLGRYAEALADHEEAVRLDPTSAHVHNNLAWFLATCPEESFRDGQRAVDHAAEACDMTNFEVWYCLGTLAAANAEFGDFEEALKWAEASLERAPAKELEGCRTRIRLYERQEPYRDTLAVASPQ